MANERRPDAQARHRGHRERVVRVLTVWLRPQFVLRVVNRFDKLLGFDRSVALASSALTASVALMIITSGVSSHLGGGRQTADRIIDRYGLTGGGAEAVKDIFSPPSGTTTSVGIVGFLLLVVAVLSFTRAAQRLFEQAWQLEPLSIRNTPNGLLWAGGLAVYIALTGFLHGALGRSALELTATLVTVPLSAGFLAWSGRVLSARRISYRDLAPFALVASVALAVYSVATVVYLPHLFSTYATRYGVIGAVLAMISALFCIMFVIVGSAAVGREVGDEFERIRRGEMPAEDEVRRQWDELTARARSR